MADATASPTLSDLVDLALRLERDEALSAAELRRRDRPIGLRLSGDRRARVLGWLEQVDSAETGPGGRVVRARRLLAVAWVALGAVLGWGTSRVVFAYDGSRPVNIVEVVAVFVGLQLVLLAVTCVALLPPAWRSAIPGLAALQDGLTVLSPGRWQMGLARWLPQAQREALDVALGHGRRFGRLFGGVQKWAFLLGSQSFGVAFHTGALAGCLYLVTFTDLAFGWSTTLDVGAGELFRWLGVISLPWSGAFPDARPTLELVESTRYFRLDPGLIAAVDEVDPASLGGWWPFCFACMAVYGLLPRAIVWAVSRRRLSAAVAVAFDQLPGVAELCDRLDSPLVEMGGEGPEAPGGGAQTARATGVAPAPEPRRCAIVNWSELPVDDDALRLAVETLLGLPASAVPVRRAGGLQTPEQDAQLLRELAEAGEDGALAVVVAVRAWEPPVGELVDFLADLRRALSDRASIVVAPSGADDRRGVAPPEASEVAPWRRRIAAVGDPWLSVRPFEVEASR